MKMNSIISLLIIIVLIFSGCSVTKLNDALDGTNDTESVTHTIDQVGFGTIIDESESEISESNVSESSISEEETDSDVQKKDGMSVVIKGVGDSLQGYVVYEEKIEGEIVRTVRGTEGVTYTLNSVTVYENIEESGITLNESILEPDGGIGVYSKTSDEIHDFIVAEMSATYIAPEGAEETVMVFTQSDFTTYYFKENLEGGLDGYLERIKIGNINHHPVYKWFEIDEAHRVERGNGWGKDAHNFYINDGETVNFKVGIFAPKELIDTKNIYICVNWFPPAYFTNDYSHKYFAIYPEE